MKKPILCLDFDGVIHSYTSRWTNARTIPDPPVDGALHFILDAMPRWSINIFSSRSHQFLGRRAMRRWLTRHFNQLLATDKAAEDKAVTILLEHTGFPETDRMGHEIVSLIKFPLFKPPARVSLDDRALQFTGEWPNLEELRSFKPWRVGARTHG